jgi:hypothetical protein
MAHPSPAFVWKAFAVPKAGHTRAEFEDAFAGDPQTGRFAVADGASESAFAATWANLLVEHYVQHPGPWSGWLPAARARWLEQCHSADMPWYLEDKFTDGAFATLLTLSFRGPERWQARAVGDCCVFHLRGEHLRRAFPVRRSEDFGNQPALLCSRSPGVGRKVKRSRLRGRWRRGDRLLVTTDALAQWFLRKVEEDRTPWNDVLGLETREAFVSWVQRLRDAREIRNDDVTLLVIDSARP